MQPIQVHTILLHTHFTHANIMAVIAPARHSMPMPRIRITNSTKWPVAIITRISIAHRQTHAPRIRDQKHDNNTCIAHSLSKPGSGTHTHTHTNRLSHCLPFRLARNSRFRKSFARNRRLMRLLFEVRLLRRLHWHGSVCCCPTLCIAVAANALLSVRPGRLTHCVFKICTLMYGSCVSQRKIAQTPETLSMPPFVTHARSDCSFIHPHPDWHSTLAAGVCSLGPPSCRAAPAAPCCCFSLWH